MKKLFLLAILCLSLQGYAQTYIPSDATSKKDAAVVLTYSAPQGGRPGARLKYPDGQELVLAGTCDEPFPWCIKNADYDDIGFMKLIFEQNGKIAKVSVKKNDASAPYQKYLDLLKGTFKKVP